MAVVLLPLHELVLPWLLELVFEELAELEAWELLVSLLASEDEDEELDSEEEEDEDISEEEDEVSDDISEEEDDEISDDTSEETEVSEDCELELLVSGVETSAVGSIWEANAVVPNTEHAKNTDRNATAILLTGLFTLRFINNAPSL